MLLEQEATYVGIDVAKAQLDVAVRPSGDRWEAPTDEAGVRQMVSRLTALEPVKVLLEASGGLELPLVAALAAEAVPVVVINPRVGGVFLPATVPSERARRRPHGFLVHGYARPGEPHTPEGWRFSDTVIETWDECLRHFPAYRDKPVIVSEWTCRTGGLTTADQYGPGGLAGDLTYTGQLYGSRAEAFCGFVGRSDNSWPDDCLLDPHGRCVRMRSDYDHLKAEGF